MPILQPGLEADPTSFMSLLRIHAGLDELFLQHQEALLALDIALARERLQEYEQGILAHMGTEEEWLLPIYRRVEPAPGGRVELFLGEHRKMRELLAGFRERLKPMEGDPPDLKRQILRLLDQEATFKNVAEHHDLREQNILYPTLDTMMEETERRELIALCVGGQSSPG